MSATRALRSDGVVHPARGEQRQSVRGGEVGEEFNFALLAAEAVALQFHIKPVAAEDRGKFFQRGAAGGSSGGEPRAAHGTFLIAGQRDQSFGETGEFLPSGETRPLPIGRIAQSAV